jgi:YHS domain-containing protein
MEGSAITNEKAKDPVCGMDVEPGRTRLVAIYQGHSYWFCANACREAFEKNPQKYLEAKPPKRKGWFGRYLERLGKANEAQFGKKGPRCH